MMKQRHSRLCASAAIAAALALPATPLFAQDAAAADPVIAEPVLASPLFSPPEPVEATVTVPVEEVTPAEPKVATPPVTSTTTTRATQTRTTTRAPASVSATESRRAATPARTVAPTTVAATAASELAVDAPMTTAEADIAAMANMDATAQPLAEAAPDSNNGNITLLIGIAGGTAALLLALWGFVAIGRRRSPARRAAAPVIERPVVERPVVARAEPASVDAYAPVAFTRPVQTPAPAANLAHSGAAVPLPRTMPATFEERDALIKRMVAARPDRANPFTGTKQRQKRAKLILQSLGRDFGRQEPWIDLSQYPQNWPQLQRRSAVA